MKLQKPDLLIKIFVLFFTLDPNQINKLYCLIRSLYLFLKQINSQEMKRQVPKFAGQQIQGRVQNYNLRLKLSPDERLSVSLHNQRMYANTEYFAQIKNQDIKKQSFQKGISNLVQIGSELFFLVKANIQQLHIPFNQIFQIGQNYSVRISVKLLINLPTSTKRKVIKFQFATSKVQIGFVSRLEKLQDRVRKLQEQLVQTKTKLAEKVQSVSLLNDFQVFPNEIIIREDSAINLQRLQQFLILKKAIGPQLQIQIRFKTRNKGLLQFNIFHYQNIEELIKKNQNQSDQLLTWIQCSIGDIVTIRLDDRGYEVLAERNQLQEVSIEGNAEKELRPTYAYTRVRKVVQFKKIINLQRAHIGIGLPFSFQILKISVEIKQKK